MEFDFISHSVENMIDAEVQPTSVSTDRLIYAQAVQCLKCAREMHRIRSFDLIWCIPPGLHYTHWGLGKDLTIYQNVN